MNTNIMDVSSELDVYIPKEAEVRVIPLNYLPNSVLKKMGVSPPERKSADSPDVIWICPAIMKKKGEGPASRRESCSLKMVQAVSPTLHLSFISSNVTAWKLLQSINSGAGLSRTRTQLLRQESAPPDTMNALLIYQERIYLCIRRSARTRGPPKPRELQPPPRPAGPSDCTSPEQDPGSELRHQTNRAAGKKRKAESPVSAASPPRQLPSPDGVERIEEVAGISSSWSSAPGPQQSWAVRQTLAAAASASSSLSRDFDFKELEDVEKIAQMKAKFLQADAALDSLLI